MVIQPGQGPIPPSSSEEKDVTKNNYVYSTMEIEDTEAVG